MKAMATPNNRICVIILSNGENNNLSLWHEKTFQQSILFREKEFSVIFDQGLNFLLIWCLNIMKILI